VLRAAVGSVLYLALIALLSLGAGTAVRAAIGAVLGLLYLFPSPLPWSPTRTGSGTWNRPGR
jgi:ABC-2 type transport system permease protein